MFVDASALTSMIVNEDDGEQLLAILFTAEHRFTSPLSIWEATIAISRLACTDIATAQGTLNVFLSQMAIAILPATKEIGEIALVAHQRYGRSRHKAALNFGDCFSYAYARQYEMPLLYKGNDFALTDLALATPTA